MRYPSRLLIVSTTLALASCMQTDATRQESAEFSGAPIISPKVEPLVAVTASPGMTPYAYIKSAAIWKWEDGQPKVIYVCWENPSSDFQKEMDIIRTAVTSTWQKNSALQFRGWSKCNPGNLGIHISIQDTGAHTKGLGKELNKKKDGMVLNFTYENWNQSCKTMKDYCNYTIAVHEFGHAIGFAHEHNRPDTPGECDKAAQGSKGDLLLTPWDPDSVMNYCNAKYANNGDLSNYDLRALQIVYGGNP